MADKRKHAQGRGYPTGKRGYAHPDGPHSGQWKPGQSGNPSGRPKKSNEMRDLERLCRENAEAAFNHLIETINDRDAPANIRLQAAKEVLDRGFGKPIDRQAVLNLDGGTAPAELSREELVKIAAGAYEQRGNAQVIEMPKISDESTPPSDLK